MTMIINFCFSRFSRFSDGFVHRRLLSTSANEIYKNFKTIPNGRTRWIATVVVAGVSSTTLLFDWLNQNNKTTTSKQTSVSSNLSHGSTTSIAHLSIHRLFASGAVTCQPDIEELNLGSVDNFPPGDMYEVKIHKDRNSLMISNINGKLHCTGASCSHYSAPLAQGVPGKDGTVHCPWHAAEFSLETGRCVGGCGLNSIPVYPLEVRDNDVFVRVPLVDQMIDSVEPATAKRDPRNHTTFGIVGAGAAALTAAETLRQEGFTGRILMFGQEPHAPYDRPVLSKNLNAKVEKLTLRSAEWLREKIDVEFFPNTKIRNVDAAKKTITTQAGKKFECDKILVATGGSPRNLNVEGSSLHNIFVLRSFDDMQRIAPLAKLDQNVVVVGSSFIGMELAGALGKAGAKVTVVGMESTPFQRVLGERIGKQMALVVNQKKVNFRGSQKVVKIHGSSGRVTGVEISNGDILQADAVIVAVGIDPNTEIISGATKLKDGSVEVDPFMQIAGCPGVYAAGDIATFPYYKTGDHIRVEHWNVAMQQGRIAAKSMLGQHVPYDSVPFFWTMVLGKSVRYAGYCADPDEIMIEGDLEAMNFGAVFVKNDQIQAIATAGKDPAAAAAIETLRRNMMPTFVDYNLGLSTVDHLAHYVKRECGKEIR